MVFLVRLFGQEEGKVRHLQDHYEDVLSLDLAVDLAKRLVARRNRQRLTKATHYEVLRVVHRGERRRKEYRKVVR